MGAKRTGTKRGSAACGDITLFCLVSLILLKSRNVRLSKNILFL